MSGFFWTVLSVICQLLCTVYFLANFLQSNDVREVEYLPECVCLALLLLFDAVVLWFLVAKFGPLHFFPFNI